MTLKIKPEHYAVLRDAIKAVEEVIRQGSPRYREAGRSIKRLQWDAFRVAVVAGDSHRWLCDALYPYMNDTHFDSALRAVWKELGLEVW